MPSLIFVYDIAYLFSIYSILRPIEKSTEMVQKGWAPTCFSVIEWHYTSHGQVVIIWTSLSGGLEKWRQSHSQTEGVVNSEGKEKDKVTFSYNLKRSYHCCNFSTQQNWTGSIIITMASWQLSLINIYLPKSASSIDNSIQRLGKS